MKKLPNLTTITSLPKWAKGIALPVLAFTSLATLAAHADQVIVASITGSAVTGNPPYAETTTGTAWSPSSLKSSAAGLDAARSGSRFIATGTPTITITPTLGVSGGVYLVEVTHGSATSISTDIVMGISSPDNSCDIDRTSTTSFQQTKGANSWVTACYITNHVGVTTPKITFTYQSGTLGPTQSSSRLYSDGFRFTSAQSCLSVAGLNVNGPLSTNLNQVVVTGVSAGATKVTVYQNSGSGFVAIGSKTTGITAGTNTVTVSGLSYLAQVGATQTVGGQEGCTPTSGAFVGRGANPSVRIALSIRETYGTGPVGTTGDTSSQIIHFLGASQVSSQAPIDAPVFYPSNTWQTVSFQAGTIGVSDTANVFGTVVPGAGYPANDYVDIQVYAYKTVNGSTAYSPDPIQSWWTVGYLTSNDVYQVQWTWDAVPGATGYRLVRQYNFNGYTDYQDVTNNSYLDANTGWIVGPPTLTPTTIALTPSIQWNPSVGNSNNIATSWGILDAIAFEIDGRDTGPFDLYIDNIKNGTTVFQTFEDASSGTSGYFFRQPSFAGSTSGNILPDPNVSAVSNLAADTGTNSLHVRFQWNGTNNTKWLRLTTSGVDPMVNMADPISFRMLLLPVGASVTPPTRPVITATHVGNNTVLNWTGTHGLQSAPAAAGPYTTINGVTSGPYTNVNSGSQKFFRLVN